MNIPTTDTRGIGGMHATEFNLLDVLMANCQSFGCCDSTAHMLHCTDNQVFRNANPRNDFLSFWVDECPNC